MNTWNYFKILNFCIYKMSSIFFVKEKKWMIEIDLQRATSLSIVWIVWQNKFFLCFVYVCVQSLFFIVTVVVIIIADDYKSSGQTRNQCVTFILLYQMAIELNQPSPANHPCCPMVVQCACDGRHPFEWQRTSHNSSKHIRLNQRLANSKCVCVCVCVCVCAHQKKERTVHKSCVLSQLCLVVPKSIDRS